ncbi:hypothetical protein P3X46_005914 [Hevea brasiliensis]|uniref:Uncharacterized protein n=1 Tax=Hevea brasiliensis TaxID=3981 RepID=A0ABQ9MNM1_HEVBR|nr:hypothetical protein P3X46_005914 [Hevea brasiliensis]
MRDKALSNNSDEVMVDSIDGSIQPELVENKGPYVINYILFVSVSGDSDCYLVFETVVVFLTKHILNCVLFFQITKSRGVAIQPLLQLSGQLHLVIAKIDEASLNEIQSSLCNVQMDNDNYNDDNEDIDECLYGEDNDESQLSSDDDKQMQSP